jgi:hypothetical protein
VIAAPADRFYRAKSLDRRRFVCKADARVGTTPILGTIFGQVNTVVAQRARDRPNQLRKNLGR